MTFGKRKITGNVSCEMLRYCSKLNTQVVGGAKRIFKYFTDKYYIEPIISYTDRRWSNGGIYRQLGFNSIRLTTPNYYYVSVGSKTRENRIQYQKHKLIDKLKTYDSKLTEWQNMQNNGYNRIWDCGQIVWRFEK
ncbi:hypothetical protein M0R04_16205 [Candidatus Dojkabacteria bacterium]|nr:hypothetical protein [Candidatus Dojkabacteria bacterium]